MKIPIESRLPSFFHNDEDDEHIKDKGQETVQDFFLSWSFHCAEEKYKDLEPRLYEFSRKIIFVLLYGFNDNVNGNFSLEKVINDSFKIKSVKTWREYKYIDIVAEIETEEDNLVHKYVLNIEDKYYTKIREGQLERSKAYITEEYKDSDFKIINAVIFCDECIIEKDPSQLIKCRENEYKLLCIGDIQTFTDMQTSKKTGNALFDEFWF